MIVPEFAPRAGFGLGFVLQAGFVPRWLGQGYLFACSQQALGSLLQILITCLSQFM